MPATNYEVRISRHAVYTNGAPVFTNGTVGLFLETGSSSGNKWFPDVLGGLWYTFADVPVMAAYLCLIALIFVVINLVVDLLYFAVDPRLRVERSAGAH